MAKETSQSEILNKMKSRGFGQALSVGKDTPPLTGNARLPAGIENGIAQVHTVRISEYKEGKNKGEMFFYAAATMLEPQTHNGVTVAKMRTQIGPEPLCETPGEGKFKTKQDHVNRMLGWLYGMGVKQGSITNEEELLAACKGLEQRKPCVRVRTWKGGKQDLRQVDGKWHLCNIGEDGSATPIPGKSYVNEAMARKLNQWAGRDPRVNEEWCGVCPPPATTLSPEQVALNGFKSPPSTASDADITPDNEFNPPGEVGEDQGAVVDGAGDTEGSEGTEAADGEPGDEAFVEEVKGILDQLVEEANAEADRGGETPSQDKMIRAARILGKNEEEIAATNTWQELADMITGAGEPAAEDAPPSCPWKKDDVCYAQSLDPKTDKPISDAKTKKVKKAVPHLIMSVDEMRWIQAYSQGCGYPEDDYEG